MKKQHLTKDYDCNFDALAKGYSLIVDAFCKASKLGHFKVNYGFNQETYDTFNINVTLDDSKIITYIFVYCDLSDTLSLSISLNNNESYANLVMQDKHYKALYKSNCRILSDKILRNKLIEYLINC